MTAIGVDQTTRERWPLVRIPVVAGVPAVIGAVVLAGLLSGCRGPSGGQGPTVSSPSAAPSTGGQSPTQQGPAYRVTATVPLGKNAGWIAMDPGTHTVYVTNIKDKTVSVIDASTRTVVATVPVGKGPGPMVVDPGTHTAYVSISGDNSVSVIESR